MLLCLIMSLYVGAAASIATALPGDPESAPSVGVRQTKREVKPLNIHLANSTEISFARPDIDWPQGTLLSDAFLRRTVGGKEQKYVSAEGTYTIEGLDKLSQPLSVNFTTWIYDAEGTVYRGKFVNQCELKSVQEESHTSETMQIGPYSAPNEGIYGPVQMNCTAGHQWKVPEDDGAYGYVLYLAQNLTMRFIEPKFYDGRPLVPYAEDGPYGVAFGMFKGLNKDGRDNFRLSADFRKADSLLTYECVLSVKEGDRQYATHSWGFGRNDTDDSFKWDQDIRGGVQAECGLKNSTTISTG